MEMYGVIPFDLKTAYGSDPDKATYSLDNGPQVTFDLPGIGGSITETIQDQMFFNVSNLSPGRHSLVVEPSGTGGTLVPLTFNYFHIHNITSSGGTGTPSGPNTAPIAEQISPSKGLPMGAIVGIAVGTVAIVAFLLTLAFVLYRHRRHRGSVELEKVDMATTPFLPPPGYHDSMGAPAAPVNSHKQNHVNVNPPSGSSISAEADGSTVMHWTGGQASPRPIIAKSAPIENVQYTYHEDSEGSGSRMQAAVKHVDVPPQYIGP